MELEQLQEHWNAFAKIDPLWAILTAPDKKNGRWGPLEFFQTGKDEIDTLMKSVATMNWSGHRQRALDFGCGVGRLTQALCGYFEECCGVDISVEMLRRAGEFNRFGSRCSYCVNTTNDLRSFSDGSFDFVYSNIVLQHMEPEYAANYIREFIRVLAPGGLIVFQLPSEMIARTGVIGTATQLPEAAFRASIRPVSVIHNIPSSSETAFDVLVKNLSSFTWPQSSVRLGNHWLLEDETCLAFDDARAELSQDLAPGGEQQLTLWVNAPSEPGAYKMELDMVQEGVAWFNNHGSETLIIPITVEPARAAGNDSTAFKARMEMYGMPLETVVGIVTQSGGRFVEIRQDTCAGLDWHSYRYCITKDSVQGGSPDRYCFRELEMPR
jgi:SAM-dependent methyltransferase